MSSSYHRPNPGQRIPRSSTFAAVAGVGLVVFGVVLSIWQKTTDSSTQPTPTASGGSVDDGVLERLQQLAPTLGGILVAVIVLAGIVLFKGRRHQT